MLRKKFTKSQNDSNCIMNVTRYTDYSLRAMIYIANKGNELSTIREIADAYGISKNHLMKIVQELGSRGYVTATRGKSGGIRLARDSKDINIGALVRDMERNKVLADCFPGGPGCAISSRCALKGILLEALEAFFATLDRYTLADLVFSSQERPELVRLLAIGDTYNLTT